MTADNDGQVVRVAPPNASALVVGIERYGFTGPRSGVQGAAMLAARFALWLDDRKICQPGRITLMTAYDGGDDSMPSPALGLEEAGKRGFNVLTQARADQDFAEWIRKGPDRDDELFVLFWVGHGCAHPGDPYEQVCLLGEDADDSLLRHVELRQLLGAAASDAPRARQVVFVDACRDVVPADSESKLAYGRRQVSPKRKEEPRASRPLSIAYAAAHGKTARRSGWRQATFADELLGRLEGLPEGQGPDQIFETDLEDLMGNRAQQQAEPVWTIYSYQHGNTKKAFLAPDESYLTQQEWGVLQTVAADCGRTRRTAPDQHLLWYAYCVAIGQALPGKQRYGLPLKLANVSDLIRTLRDMPAPADGLPPPLVHACDLVVRLSRPGTQPGLASWCESWAGARDDGGARLAQARQWYPAQLPEDTYLSIMIENVSAPSQGRKPRRSHYISAVLWTAGGPEPLEVAPQAAIPEKEILPAVQRLIEKVRQTHKVPDPQKMVVEFVLPETLLGWPTRPEQKNLGVNYPLVVRDLDRLIATDVPGRSLAEARWRNIEQYARGRKPSWREKIEWLEFGPGSDNELIEGMVANDEVFCIALVPRQAGPQAAGHKNGIPPMLIDAIRAGAAIVVWIYHDDHNHYYGQYQRNGRPYWHGRRWRPGGNSSRGCAIPHIRSQINRGVSKKGGGLLELPVLLRKIRQEITKRESPPPQIGVLMENTSRFTPNYFGLGIGAAPAGGRK